MPELGCVQRDVAASARAHHPVPTLPCTLQKPYWTYLGFQRLEGRGQAFARSSVESVGRGRNGTGSVSAARSSQSAHAGFALEPLTSTGHAGVRFAIEIRGAGKGGREWLEQRGSRRVGAGGRAFTAGRHSSEVAAYAGAG